MSVTRKIIWSAIALGAVAMFISLAPDMRRYIKMECM
jgi:hypothetical protein